MLRATSCIVSLVLASIAAAQDEPAPQARSVRVLALGDPPPFRQEIIDGVRVEAEPPPGSVPPPELTMVAPATKPEDSETIGTVTLRLGRFSEPLPVDPGPGPLVLRGIAADATTDWLKFSAPAAGPFSLLAWRRLGAGWDRPAALALPDGIAEFPANQVRIVNISPIAVGLLIGDSKIALLPGLQHKFNAPPDNEVEFSIGIQTGNGPLRGFHTGTISHNESERSLIVIYRADGENPRRPLKVFIYRENTSPTQVQLPELQN